MTLDTGAAEDEAVEDAEDEAVEDAEDDVEADVVDGVDVGVELDGVVTPHAASTNINKGNRVIFLMWLLFLLTWYLRTAITSSLYTKIIIFNMGYKIKFTNYLQSNKKDLYEGLFLLLIRQTS